MQKMNSDSDNSESSPPPGRLLHTVRPLRDLESNWAVDLAKSLEEYLLKLCSGQIIGDEDATLSVNFAEAALLLQGSVQVYSRKVEYLYSLVLHAINFISKQSQEDEVTSSSRPISSDVHSSKEEGDDPFWGLDDIPVDEKNLLVCATRIDEEASGHFARPPPYLVVLEGECLDSVELESYLLAGSVLYQDFILLDSSDAASVDNLLDSRACKGPTSVYRTSPLSSKGRKSFQSPSRPSRGTAEKLSAKKKIDVNVSFETNDCSIGHSPPPVCDFPSDENGGFGTRDADAEREDFNDSDDDDPWKPLNPHELGNLKVEPYRKVEAKPKLIVSSRKHQSLPAEFPLAKLGSLISPDLNEIWEAKLREKLGKSEPLPLYEKLWQSLVLGEKQTGCAVFDHETDADDNGFVNGDPDLGPSYFDMPDHEYVPMHKETENPEAHANLEEICRSHLDPLLDTLDENEKQTELATRVSTWKQRIEQGLEEQESHPPFDIHEYGERVLVKLSMEEETLSFGDVVKGQKKHDVARTFSALLQLVNNGDVDLVRSSSNKFRVRLLRNEKKKEERSKYPLLKVHKKKIKGKENSSPLGLSSVGKSSRSTCTPQGKKRRKSPILAPFDVNIK